MTHLGRYWARGQTGPANLSENNAKIAVCHRVDIAGVASSILATPTMKSPVAPLGRRGYF